MTKSDRLKLFFSFLLATAAIGCNGSDEKASVPSEVNSDFVEYCEPYDYSPHDFTVGMNPFGQPISLLTEDYQCVVSGYTCHIFFASTLYFYDTCNGLINYELKELL